MVVDNGGNMDALDVVVIADKLGFKGAPLKLTWTMLFKFAEEVAKFATNEKESNKIEIIRAIVAYAGPFDDPRIGWIGKNPSNKDLFKCERCGMENMDSSRIEHKDGCSAKELLNALEIIKSL